MASEHRFSIDPVAGLVVERFAGRLSLRELMAGGQEINGHPDFRMGYRYLVDLRAATVTLAGTDVRTLADFIEADASTSTAVESFLGSLTRALVVRDGAAVERLASWFAESWESGGGLVLLPLDGVPPVAGDGALLSGVRAHGDGEAWVRVLLAGLTWPAKQQLRLSGVRTG